MPALSVLLVEDDFLIRACLSEYLQDSDIAVYEADTKAEAILHLDSADPVSVLVTDLSLPDGSGADVGTHARRQHPDLPIVYISGHGAAVGDAVATDPGRDRFISKPYTLSAVLDAITDLTRVAY